MKNHYFVSSVSNILNFMSHGMGVHLLVDMKYSDGYKSPRIGYALNVKYQRKEGNDSVRLDGKRVRIRVLR